MLLALKSYLQLLAHVLLLCVGNNTEIICRFYTFLKTDINFPLCANLKYDMKNTSIKRYISLL